MYTDRERKGDMARSKNTQPHYIVIAVLFLFYGVVQFNKFDIYSKSHIDSLDRSKQENEKKANYHHPAVNTLDIVTKCSPDQMAIMEKQIGLNNPRCGREGCPLHKLTKCPDSTWLKEYYKQDFKNRTDIHSGGPLSFLGLTIGCNKGFDAIETARMWMNDARFDKLKWVEAMSKIAKKRLPGACGQGTAPQVDVLADEPVRSGEMHCVEPLPSTSQALLAAAKDTGLINVDDWGGEQRKGSSNAFVISPFAISSADGAIKFPSAGVYPGTEHFGMGACNNDATKAGCEEVPMYSLQTYVNKFVTGKGPINLLSIDVEGFDFEVLFGAGDVLDRTEYLEFEFHGVGNWIKYRIMDAVNLLNGKGYTCYWAGTGKLWRLTECDHDFYNSFHQWSNVACVHRSQTVLAKKMEDLFVRTLGG